MRTFRFRVWDARSRKWLHDTEYCVYNGHPFELETGGTEYLDNESSYNPTRFCEDNAGAPFFNDNLILQQYTGMNDKNGKEIYEGDIIKGLLDFGPGGLHERTLPVHWHNLVGYQWNCWIISTIEVIGNIFEGVKTI